MVLKADQERVKTLLKDTITLLCRNGLTFKSKFSIEALIGVTLDDSDVFLISINELIQTEKVHEELEKETENASGVDSPISPSEGSRDKKRRRTHVKIEASLSGNEDNGDGESLNSSHAEESQSPSLEPHVKRHTNINTMKKEVNEDSEDIVFIKEEPKETVWQEGQTESLFSDMSNAANSSLGNDQNFPSLADMNLVPVASQEENTLWTTNQTNQMMSHLQQRTYRPRGPRTSTVTMGSMGDGQSSQDTSQVG
ncbi:hypothetical protein LSH36_625g01015 [Paralvinella palmiformis]|uniref:Uncharacterized protein n=1 Tax=Paralvinella palmiformis TaxID=53620 RepID=A0AAD9J528_9ANNE|nr:hypothetical protein LSH36_625g01015 [Paralvinella palmiformis]